MIEFFEQGDQERKRDLAISPLCDRHSAKIAQSQIGRFLFICKIQCCSMAAGTNLDLAIVVTNSMYDFLEWYSARKGCVNKNPMEKTQLGFFTFIWRKAGAVPSIRRSSSIR